MSVATEQPILPQLSPSPELPAQDAPELPAQDASVAPEARTSRKATWALVCGIAGLIVFALLFSTVAIALGVVAKNEIDRDPQLHGRGKATAGIVLGVIGLVFFAVFLAATVATS
jgi:hypothetical protein